jgi:hypothetical protein
MATDLLEKINEIHKETHAVFLITCDREGIAHSDGIMSMEPLSGGDIKIKGWFSWRVISNLESNPHVTLIVWNAREHGGYQLKGSCVKRGRIAYLDGILQGREADVPQVEWELVVRVDTQTGLCRQL